MGFTPQKVKVFIEEENKTPKLWPHHLKVMPVSPSREEGETVQWGLSVGSDVLVVSGKYKGKSGVVRKFTDQKVDVFIAEEKKTPNLWPHAITLIPTIDDIDIIQDLQNIEVGNIEDLSTKDKIKLKDLLVEVAKLLKKARNRRGNEA